jgi:hypothetical protein
MALFGIETEADCCAKFDELLALHELADQARDKSTVAALKSSLEVYYKKGNTLRGERQMSPVEQRYFWPAVVRAFVRAPNLGKPGTWDDGLYEIRLNLMYYRPRQ